MERTDARAPFVAAVAYYKAGDANKAEEWYDRTIARCAKLRGVRLYELANAHLLSATAQAAQKNSWWGVLERAAQEYVAAHGAGLDGAPFAGDARRSPALLWAARLVAQKRWEDLLAWHTTTGPAVFRQSPALLERIRTVAGAPAMAAALLPRVEKAGTADAYRALAQWMRMVYAPGDAALVLDAACAKLRNASLQLERAQAYGAAGDFAAAAKAAEEGLKVAEGGADAALEEALALYLARLRLLTGDRPGARAVMARLVDRKRTTRGSHVAEVLVLVAPAVSSERDLALRLLEEARTRFDAERAAGWSPYLQLARVHEALADAAPSESVQARAHAIESIRYWRGHEKLGSSLRPWPIDEQLTITLDPEGVSLDAATARAKLYGTLKDDDYFVKQMLKERFGKLDPDVEKAIREHVRVLSDDAAPGKSEAIAALKRMPRNSAPLLAEACKTAGEWAAYEIGKILRDWAEPIPD